MTESFKLDTHMNTVQPYLTQGYSQYYLCNKKLTKHDHIIQQQCMYIKYESNVLTGNISNRTTASALVNSNIPKTVFWNILKTVQERFTKRYREGIVYCNNIHAYNMYCEHVCVSVHDVKGCFMPFSNSLFRIHQVMFWVDNMVNHILNNLAPTVVWLLPTIIYNALLI